MAESLNNDNLSTPDANLEESELANTLQEFVTLLTKNQSRIRSFIVALMPGNPDVGDVLQETNLVLWKSRDRFQPGTNFRAWAFTVARLEILHYRARTKRSNRILLSEELLDLITEEMPKTDDHETYLNALETCKAKLPEKQRELITVRYHPDHSLEQLAQQTGRKASALRVALLRIRTTLRQCIEKSLTQRSV